MSNFKQEEHTPVWIDLQSTDVEELMLDIMEQKEALEKELEQLKQRIPLAKTPEESLKLFSVMSRKKKAHNSCLNLLGRLLFYP